MVNWVPTKPIDTALVNQLLKDSIISNQFTNYGPNVKKLEKTITTLLEIDETKSVICVANATLALYAAVASIELSNDKELQFATQSFTFPASAQGYLKNVKIIDIDAEGGIDLTQCLDYDGIIVTNIFGSVVDIAKYVDWSVANNKILIFDNAATPFTKYNGSNSCNYGTASIVSFHHTKPLGYGEGGCVIIDKKYESYVRRIINFGFEPIVNPKWSKFGSNYKMSDIQAVYIIQYLERFNEIVSKHKSLTTYFYENMSVEQYPNFSSETPFLSCFCIFVENSQDKLKRLIEKGVIARKYYIPLVSTPIANAFYDKVLCIPCTVDMTFSDLDNIFDILK